MFFLFFCSLVQHCSEHFLLSGSADGVIILWGVTPSARKVPICFFPCPFLIVLVVWIFGAKGIYRASAGLMLTVEVYTTSTRITQQRCYMHHWDYGLWQSCFVCFHVLRWKCFYMWTDFSRSTSRLENTLDAYCGTID